MHSKRECVNTSAGSENNIMSIRGYFYYRIPNDDLLLERNVLPTSIYAIKHHRKKKNNPKILFTLVSTELIRFADLFPPPLIVRSSVLLSLHRTFRGGKSYRWPNFSLDLYKFRATLRPSAQKSVKQASTCIIFFFFINFKNNANSLYLKNDHE